MMRRALCISGLPREIDEGYRYIKENILDPFPHTDVFISTWTDEKANALIKKYKPVAHEVEKPIDIWRTFTDKYPYYKIHPHCRPKGKVDRTNFLNMVYKIWKCNELKKKQEQARDFPYDHVIRCRSDIKINYLNFATIPRYDPAVWIPTWPDLDDRFAIGSSQVMDIYSNLWNEMPYDPKIGRENFAPHFALKKYLAAKGIPVREVSLWKCENVVFTPKTLKNRQLYDYEFMFEPAKKPDKITLVCSFYMDNMTWQVARLDTLLKVWKNYPTDIKDRVNIVMIDDASPRRISEYYKQQLRDLNANIELYRIQEDIPWNLPGALNLAASAARTDWILRTDSDFYFDADNLRKILFTPLKPSRTYFFSNRTNITNDETIPTERDRHLGNAHLIHKRNWFWQGGQDEDFAGGYDYNDTIFNTKLMRNSRIEHLDIKITHMLVDVAGHGPKTKTMYYKNRKMRAERETDFDYLNNRSTKMLRFPWVLEYVGVKHG